MTHKSEDYKISAVKYYLKNKDNIRNTCKIFDCKKSTLQRWIKRYKTSKNITRRNRKPISYKIAYNAINNKGRPNYLSRSKNSSTGLDEPVKSKFTRLEIGKPC
jgi:transposase-like protein